MSNAKHSPDLLFEVSWEVCNKVGGIHTVISTKAQTVTRKFADRYVLLGPDLSHEGVNPEFEEDPNQLKAWRQSLYNEGIRVRVGRWKIKGEPTVVLVDFSSLIPRKDEILKSLWESYHVDSISGQWDYIEPVLFGWAAGVVIASYVETFGTPTEKAVAHFHEWMTAAGGLYLRKHAPYIATVFTTHATVMGRCIAGNRLPLYNDLPKFNADELARQFNVTAKHSIEKMAAAYHDAFLTVSDITANECKYLLGREPDGVTPNGFENDFVWAGEEYYAKRDEARRAMISVAEACLGEKFTGDPLIVGTSGRYEFRNKGIDGLIVVPCEGADEIIRDIARQNIPLVLLDREVPDLEVSSVVLNNRRAGHETTEALIRRGFTRIEMISYSMGLSNIREREEGYRRCMQAHEMGENAVIHHLRHDKFAKIEEIIREARQRRVEAFLFATNTLAGQGLSAIFRNGWRVPQDFAIACFDTNEAFDIYKTAIAYVRQPIERFGTEALDLLIKSIEQRDKPGSCTRIVLTPEIVESAPEEALRSAEEAVTEA